MDPATTPPKTPNEILAELEEELSRKRGHKPPPPKRHVVRRDPDYYARMGRRGAEARHGKKEP